MKNTKNSFSKAKTGRKWFLFSKAYSSPQTGPLNRRTIFVKPPAKFHLEGRDKFSHSPGKSHKKGILFFKNLRSAPLGKPNSVLTFLWNLIRLQPDDDRETIFFDKLIFPQKNPLDTLNAVLTFLPKKNYPGPNSFLSTSQTVE